MLVLNRTFFFCSKCSEKTINTKFFCVYFGANEKCDYYAEKRDRCAKINIFNIWEIFYVNFRKFCKNFIVLSITFFVKYPLSKIWCTKLQILHFLPCLEFYQNHWIYKWFKHFDALLCKCFFYFCPMFVNNYKLGWNPKIILKIKNQINFQILIFKTMQHALLYIFFCVRVTFDW